jgi:hypothetical protein
LEVHHRQSKQESFVGGVEEKPLVGGVEEKPLVGGVDKINTMKEDSIA